ncbi:MAG: iron chelate uptake ABC transporter family permease subunit [Bradyrhizobium sp.]|nr:iron chelate uptake ABC transporter family permease subunit [Bradyrhizobium sp.]
MNDMTPTREQREAALEGMGCRRKRVEDIRFTQGKGNYVDDVKLPGMLHGDFVRSPHAHARVKAIHTEEALKVPGVLAVITAETLKTVNLAWMPTLAGDVQMVLAIIGAGVAAGAVYAIGSLGRGGASPLKLALAGAATGAALVSFANAILLPRAQALDSYRFWQIGGLGRADWSRMSWAIPALVIAFATAAACARGLNAMALGDDLARGLGEDVARTRALSSIAAVVLCGVATALAGPIAFVGLIVPHLFRLLLGPDHRWLLPFAALGGAGLLLAADVVGRVIARPEQIAVGIITPLLGAPFFIWIVRRQRGQAL